MGGRQEVAPGLVFSGTAARFVGYIIDSFLLAIVSGVVSSIFGGRSTFATSPGQIPQVELGAGYVVATLVSVVISAIYFIGFWSGGRRATLGQMAVGIQVGNAFDGKPLTTTQAAKRWIGLGQFLQVFALSFGAAAAIGGLSLLWLLVLFISTATSPTKQGLHDKFANSAVVRPIGASNVVVYGCLILLVIVILLPFLFLIALFPQMSTVLSEIGQSI